MADENHDSLITIAIPLYNSGRFLEIISNNIDSLPQDNVEILLSDRHGDKAAMEMLKNRLSTDKRCRFIFENDRLDWVDHYNLLLKEGKGKYFMWMPHDDTFPPGYVYQLVNNLINDESLLLSFGNIQGIDIVSNKRWLLYLPAYLQKRIKKGGPFFAIYMLSFWQLDIPFRGVFRRDRIIEQQLLIRKIGESTEFSDRYWIFGAMLLGKLNYNPEQHCIKRYYPDNTHYQWNVDNYFIHSVDARKTIKYYIKKAEISNVKRWQLGLTISIISRYKKHFRFLSPFVFKHSGEKAVNYRKNLSDDLSN